MNNILPLDHKYRKIVNKEIAPKLKKAIETGIKKEFYGEFLLQVIVELKTISPSSLDLITIAKFTGDAASEYFEIGWKLQQLALEVCNKNEWDIPLPQLVLHQENQVRFFGK